MTLCYIIVTFDNLESTFHFVPQVNLHGFDEGLVEKLNFGVLDLFIRLAWRRNRMYEAPVTL